MKSHEYVGSCVTNPFKTVKQLIRIIETAIDITEDTFIRHCNVPREIRELMIQFPRSYSYHRGKLGRKYIYFYVNSCIEYFFVEGVMLSVQETVEDWEEEEY